MMFLRALWAFPWTACGLLLGLVMCVAGGRMRWRDGCLEVTGGAGGRLAGRCTPFAAMTLGHVILAISADEARRLGAHEREHVRQYGTWGPLFVPAYLLAGVWQWAHGRCPHADNPFERDAGVTA